MNRNRFPSAFGVGVALLLVSAGCGGAQAFPQAAPPTSRPSATPAEPKRVTATTATTLPPSTGTTPSLRDALTAELVVYTDNQWFDPNPANMKAIEPTVDWDEMKVVVGTSGGGLRDIVCLSQTANGVTNSLADVVNGPSAGIYYGRGCPSDFTAEAVAASGTRA